MPAEYFKNLIYLPDKIVGQSVRVSVREYIQNGGGGGGANILQHTSPKSAQSQLKSIIIPQYTGSIFSFRCSLLKEMCQI